MQEPLRFVIVNGILSKLNELLYSITLIYLTDKHKSLDKMPNQIRFQAKTPIAFRNIRSESNSHDLIDLLVE